MQSNKVPSKNSMTKAPASGTPAFHLFHDVTHVNCWLHRLVTKNQLFPKETNGVDRKDCKTNGNSKKKQKKKLISGKVWQQAFVRLCQRFVFLFFWNSHWFYKFFGQHHWFPLKIIGFLWPEAWMCVVVELCCSERIHIELTQYDIRVHPILSSFWNWHSIQLFDFIQISSETIARPIGIHVQLLVRRSSAESWLLKCRISPSWSPQRSIMTMGCRFASAQSSKYASAILLAGTESWAVGSLQCDQKAAVASWILSCRTSSFGEVHQHPCASYWLFFLKLALSPIIWFYWLF